MTEFKSASIALDRLSSMLIHDRAQLTEDCLQDIRSDIINVLSSYLSVSEEGLELEVETLDNKSVIRIAVPLA